MKNFLECRVKYTAIDEKTGKEKKVSEIYLVEAETYGSAEDRIYKELESFVDTGFSIRGMKLVRFADVLDAQNYPDIWSDDALKYYISKISYQDPESTTKKIVKPFLIIAESTEDAGVRLKGLLKIQGFLSDFEVVSVSETNIADIFYHDL